MASLDDLNSTQQGISKNISQLVAAFQAAFPRISGTVKLTAGTITVVAQPDIASSGIPLLVPTNGPAALLVRTNGIYVSAVVAGASFSISVQNGNAAGTETFSYIVVNPS